MLIQNGEAPAHQFVVIRLIPRGPPEFFDSGFLSDSDPDFGSQHSFHVQSDNRLFHGRRVFQKHLSVSRTPVKEADSARAKYGPPPYVGGYFRVWITRSGIDIAKGCHLLSAR